MEKKIMTALSPYKNYDGYIYNLKLQISISSGESYANRGKILKAVAALIVARLVHKYPVWKVMSSTIFTTLLDELTLQLPTFISGLLWKSNIKIKAIKFGVPLELGTPIIYDNFSYGGLLSPVNTESSLEEYYSKPIDLSYSMSFFISPALETARTFYKSEGYFNIETGITASTLIYYINFLNRVRYDIEYDHAREWQNIIELTDYQNELTNKNSVIENLKVLKCKYENILKAMDEKK